jgi:DNA-binding MurR/RpiR family transcriptional regulator
MTSTVSNTIEAVWPTLTEAEKKVAHAILSGYPLSGLGSISDLADKAHVSTATITRFVARLGYSGFIVFREELRSEVAEQFRSPIDKQRALSAQTPLNDTGFLGLLNEVCGHIQETAGQIQEADFTEVVRLLSDRSRRVFLAGGRMTRSVVTHLATMLHAMRSDVHMVDAGSIDAAEQMIDMRGKDVFVIMDVRRYQRSAIELAQRAAAKGCIVVLITDEWISPISTHANLIFALKVGTNSIWDSLALPLLFGEALVNAVGLEIWPKAQPRLRELEAHWTDWMTFESVENRPSGGDASS